MIGPVPYRATVKFDRRFVGELMGQARSLSQRQCEYMANVGIRKELEGKRPESVIRVLEDLYWSVAAGKAAATRAGISGSV